MSAVAALGAIGGAFLVSYGFSRIELICFGECEGREDDSWASLVMLVGLLTPVLALGGLAWANRPRTTPARAAVAVPAALLCGFALYRLGFADLGRWAENVSLFAMVATVAGIAVPPTSRRWWVAALGGAVVAGAFGDEPMPGILVAAIVFVLGIDLPQRPTRRLDAPCRQQPEWSDSNRGSGSQWKLAR